MRGQPGMRVIGVVDALLHVIQAKFHKYESCCTKGKKFLLPWQ